ncbi:MAG: hypothetical protein HY912_19750 [Desulfomonile tiedjei]|uniref:Uncharacterized protein n=1 Tax=Desulfomonile tiedjei TaxID=2358 RepID=A0A9D6V6R7_9BACT|nr:hypothetical protein [Desulfomonile tiedjei]
MPELSVFLGGIFAILAVIGLVQDKRFTFAAMVVVFSVSAALLAVGLLGLRELIAPAWVTVSVCGILGILNIILATGKLSCKPVAPCLSYLFWGLGVATVLAATVSGLRTYGH